MFPAIISAQNISMPGIVVDKENNEPLAFVNIISSSGYGSITDIDGKFDITINPDDSCLTLSYIGYETKIFHINLHEKEQFIQLSPKSFELEEVTILPGINPAHRIINNVIANRNINNPNKLKSFSYISYDKMVITINADSILDKDVSNLDTNQMRVRKFIESKDLFLLETVTERKYISPGLNQENILATKVSGLNDPVMAFMISQIQSTSFYDEIIQIAGSNYVNPISKGSTNNYFFLIEDTIYSNTNDSIYIISFKPKTNKKFDGLTGFLHINNNRWAIQNVKAEPQDNTTGISIKIQQSYEFIQDHWFPVQLNTDIIFRMASASDGSTNYPLIGNGRSYIRDINLNPDLKKKDFSYHEVEINKEATKRKGEFWKEYRVDSLTARELETYRFIDSIGKAENFDKMASTFQTLLTGKIPYKFINIDMDKFIHYNNYEGLYLGLGLHTNHKISSTFSVGGYWGYGFRDESAKFGGDLSIKIHKPSESTIRIDAYDKVTPSGDVEFFDDKNQIWRPEYFYKFFYKQMNRTIGGELNYTFRIRPLRDFSWVVGIRTQEKYTYDSYYFTSTDEPWNPVTNFSTTDFMLGFKFSFREKILQTTKGQISLGSKFPVVWLNYTKGVQGILNGDYSFNRYDLKISFDHFFKYIGESSIVINAGIIDGQLPISNLYSGVGSYNEFTVYAPVSFGTMGANEFYSDQYISLFLSHNFKDLLFSFRNYKPELMIVTNVGFGSLKNPGDHHNLDFSTQEKGYYESGIIIRKLLNLQIYELGAGVLYRYGPYGFDKQSKNFAYKLSIYYTF